VEEEEDAEEDDGVPAAVVVVARIAGGLAHALPPAPAGAGAPVAEEPLRTPFPAPPAPPLVLSRRQLAITTTNHNRRRKNERTHAPRMRANERSLARCLLASLPRASRARRRGGGRGLQLQHGPRGSMHTRHTLSMRCAPTCTAPVSVCDASRVTDGAAVLSTGHRSKKQGRREGRKVSEVGRLRLAANRTQQQRTGSKGQRRGHRDAHRGNTQREEPVSCARSLAVHRCSLGPAPWREATWRSDCGTHVLDSSTKDSAAR
jgi:hypothetical protein